MTINYTSLLGLAQPVTGTESGTWGTVVNDEITALVEEAVAGGESIDVTAGNVTLSTTAGVANQARNAILLITGTPGTSRNVVAPSSSKVYVVVNGSDSAIVLKGAATTGVTIASGSRSLVAWNGSDFVEVGQAGDVDGPTSSTDNAVARFDGASGKIIQNSAVTIADTTGDITGGKYNGLTVSSTTGTFTLTNGKTFAVQNTVTLAGTDSTTMTFPATSQTLAGLGVSSQIFTTAQTFRAASAIRSEAASTQDAIVIAGRAGGTSSYAVTLTPATLSASRTVTLADGGGNYTLGYINAPAVGTKTSSYSLATTDVGKYVQVSTGGSITIPDATFAEGDIISVFNNTSGAITITCTITTAYIAGTDSDKASVSLATRGVATILFISGTVCVISGNVS